MAPELQYLLTEDREGWIKYETQSGEREPWVLWKLFVRVCKHPIQMWGAFKNIEKLPPQDEANLSPENMPSHHISSLRRELLGNFCIFLASLAFSAIHIAAWNSSFPTEAEKNAWRILSVVTFALCLPVYIVMQLPYIRGRIARFKITGLPNYNNPSPNASIPESAFLISCCILYGVARLATFVLMFMSLRALPAGCYISIDWLTTIPHV